MKIKHYIIVIVILLFISCRNDEVSEAFISFPNANGNIDTVVINKKDEIKLIDAYIRKMVAYGDKFPAQYYLTVRHTDGKVKNFMCNGAALKDKATYIVQDTDLQKRYLEFINAKLPHYLQQNQ